jgi:hypothetical protein
MPERLPAEIKELTDWDDGEPVLVTRGKTHPWGADPYDPIAAAHAVALQLPELAARCPTGHYLKRGRIRRERLEKGRGYYLELAFAPRPTSA